MSYLLVDLNQILISNIVQYLNHAQKTDEVNADLIRHMSINAIRASVRQFKSKYPNIILCCDSKHYWRKEVFPFYKSQRKVDRANSKYDWHMIFDTLSDIRAELTQFFPYKVINVDGAEADDAIAVLAARLSPQGDVLILSSDKDFGQLQKYPNVSQYSPILKRFVKIEDPHSFVKEHIIRGDRGDGIPNILSSDNVFAIGERQKPLNSKKLQEWLSMNAEDFCATDAMFRNFKRNQTLIDFDHIPRNIQESIVVAYDEAKPATKQVMLEYFIEKGLMAMIESINDF